MNTTHDDLDREEKEILDRLRAAADACSRANRHYQHVSEEAARRLSIIDEWRKTLLEKS